MGEADPSAALSEQFLQMPGMPFIYIPSFSISALGSTAFLLCSVVTTLQCIWLRAWYLNLLPQAALVTTAAMIARTHGTLHLNDVPAFTASRIALRIPSSLIAISAIFTFTRVMWWVTPSTKRNFRTLGCPPRFISAIWITMVALSDIVKTAGVVLPSSLTIEHIEEIGLIVQFFVFAVFAGLTARFMLKSRSWLINDDAEAKGWKKLGWSLPFVAAMLTLRTTFAIVSIDGAPRAPLAQITAAAARRASFVATHEWLFWIADALPLLLAFGAFMLYHPGTYLPREYTGLRFRIDRVSRVKSDLPWQMTISNPLAADGGRKRDETKFLSLRLHVEDLEPRFAKKEASSV